ISKLFDFNSDSVFYHNFPPSYMAGILNQFIVPLLNCSKIAIGDRFGALSALTFWEKPMRFSVNKFFMSPTMLSLILSLDRKRVGKKYLEDKNATIITATAPLSVDLRHKFENTFGIKLFESFGLTETLFNASNCPNTPVIDSCAGYILDGVVPEIAEDGELIIYCDWMFIRYFTEPDNTRHTFFATGDIAEIMEDNSLFIIGRKKDLIIKGGMNISPARIEKELAPLLSEKNIEYSVVGIHDTVMGEKIVLAYVYNQELNNKKEINAALVKALGNEYKIDEFIMIDKIPVNSLGKIMKREIKKSIEKM
ncbi:MAG: acyl--CoA ligase, partial [Clostridiales bacterium]|nr:acyl--CoA ligase [Clostridiales bacterium]